MSLLPHRPYVPFHKQNSKKYSAYSYRKETGTKYHKPGLGMSGKLAATNGFVFRNAPMFKQLLKDDDRDPKSLLVGGRDNAVVNLSKKDFQKEIKQYEKVEKKVEKKKDEKGPPKIQDVRQSLHDMCYFHDQKCQRNIPCVYPLTGAISLNDEELNEDDNGSGEGSDDNSDGGSSGSGGETRKRKRRRGRYNYKK